MTNKFIYNLILIAWLLVCFNANAQLLDNSFNTNGIWTRQIRTASNSLNDIIIQPDGKIIYAGCTQSSNLSDPSYFAVGRINSDGSNDNSFDSDGVVEYTFNTGGYDCAYSICYLNGKIYAVGNNTTASTSDYLLVRLNSDGSIDNTFNSNGKISPVIEPSSNGSSVVVKTNDNNIIVLGESSTSLPTFHLSGFKVDENANFINGYGTSGKTILNTMSSNFYPDEVEVLGDNSILIVNNLSLIKIKQNGHLDSTFGTNGVLDLSGLSSSYFTGLSVQKDGKILLCNSDDNQNFSVYRLASTGTLDATFGTNGKVTVLFNGISSGARTVIVDTTSFTGKIYAAGFSAYNGGTVSYMALARISSVDGSIEAQAEFRPDNLNSEINGLLIQPDGKIVVGGNSLGYSVEDLIVARVNPNFTTVVATGVQESLSESIGINLYPNPASHIVNIHSISEVEFVKIFDMLGNEMYSKSLKGNSQLDISFLPRGLYNFVITTDKGIGSKKVSIQ